MTVITLLLAVAVGLSLPGHLPDQEGRLTLHSVYPARRRIDISVITEPAQKTSARIFVTSK
jgi:hypothetical protein